MDLLGRAKRYLSGEPGADLGTIGVVGSLLGLMMGVSLMLLPAYLWFEAGPPVTLSRTYSMY